ncbi:MULTISPECIES: sugar ABC transporter substrate-binding protein [Rhodopseudomonas]|uniref:sugar ABC transporter substrate-binding protein n=1 Tax=Rhodopseudomonas TaxID=1073 RepID=UPI0009BA7D98|nr:MULTISPECIES: sugar ABC transporter substrate-binding protein [Rhodopseudomonas]MDF3811404.1 sugar ABC transporter substrate-binding protein [Rhodopseudomonas sp. BAL398]WOK16299.1 sugar ABC transporter substrate-binding protein [Rhodopseudomonas sp. BAL398]
MSKHVGRIMRRSSAVLAVVIGLTMAMPAARADEATPQTKGKKVALMVATLQDYYMALLNRLVIARAKDFGMEITTFTTPYDPALQSTQIDEAIARKFDMIVMIAMSEHAVIPALQRAKQAKIPVIMFVAPPKPGSEDLFVSFVGEDNVALGRISGQSILDALKASGRDGGNVALVTGLLAEGLAPRRVTGIKEVLARNKKVKIVAIEDAKWDPVLTEKISGQLYGRFAGQGGIDVIYGMADNMATASIQAAEAAGIKVGIGPGKMAVIGGDCFKEGIEAIKAGKMFATATQIPTWEAAKTVEVAASYFNGKPVSKYEYFPIEAVTKDNLAKWEGPCTF